MHLAKVAIASAIVITSSLFIATAAADTPTAAAPRKISTPSQVSSHLGVDAAIQAEVNRRAVAVVQFATAVNQAKADAAKAAVATAEKAAATSLRSQAPATSSSGLRAVNWDGIARCETGGNWQHQTQFDGGLGILHANWINWGGREFAEYGSQATREQQIIVAERMYHTFGNLNGWGCHAYG